MIIEIKKVDNTLSIKKIIIINSKKKYYYGEVGYYNYQIWNLKANNLIKKGFGLIIYKINMARKIFLKKNKEWQYKFSLIDKNFCIVSLFINSK